MASGQAPGDIATRPQVTHAGAESIGRRKSDDSDGLDFESLFRQGLSIVQEVSGKNWTDYNQHDPGVTILEALCYVLTELVYRTGFPVADMLPDSEGRIDFARQALYRPEEIFPSHPVTESDYRKLILTSIPFIDNVWIRPVDREEAGRPGLSRIYVQLSERVSDQDQEVVARAFCDVVRKLYGANRNLCEDLAGVEVVRRIPFSLRGEVEIDGKREPADILAEICFECSQYMSPRVPVHSHAERFKQGESLEELFTGVFSEKGYIDDDELYPWRGHFSISDLVSVIAGIDGVKNINQLAFVDGFGNETDSINLESSLSHRAVACLTASLPIEDMRLIKGGKVFPISRQDVQQEFRRLDYTYQVSRQHSYSFEWLEELLPQGVYRKLGEYYSMQNHFPDIYGLNAFGVPDTATDERKAQAAQLNAYLLFFEQVMANFLQHMHEIPRLFSVDGQLSQSYFHQVLDNDAVPGVEPLYLDGMDGRLAGLMRRYDNFDDRRNRILDFLLALYGEKFSQNSLRHFFPEHTKDQRIDNKLAFVKHIVQLGKNRSAAFDDRNPVSGDENCSGLESRLGLLLGLRESEAVRDENSGDSRAGEFHLVEHILLRPTAGARHQNLDVPEGFYGLRLSLLFAVRGSGSSGLAFRQLVEETVARNCPAHIHPEVFWLDVPDMTRFRELHDSWLQARRTPTLAAQVVDEAASALLGFLLELRKPPAT
ncbi:MAG: hypothetical protein AUK36_03540 [Zetaproteobacteria bacterium CG2_30_59_37]|nr:MAG: hypothetical protein AUK36_03540 [Zetaproteobacteria bacterium CG2_30_59_37]